MFLRRIMPVRNRKLFIWLYVGIRLALGIGEYQVFHGHPPAGVVIGVSLGVVLAMWALAHALGWYDEPQSAPVQPVPFANASPVAPIVQHASPQHEYAEPQPVYAPPQPEPNEIPRPMPISTTSAPARPATRFPQWNPPTHMFVRDEDSAPTS